MTTPVSSKAGLFTACIMMAISVMFFTGCGSSGPQRYDVSGKVTYDGKPIKQGSIVFEPLNRSLGAEGGTITDGRFQGKAKEGKNKVRITALDIGPNTRYVNGIPMVSNFLPEKYNDKTELEVEVTSSSRAFDFELTVN